MSTPIGESVNGWQLFYVEAKDSITKTSYAYLFNGRITIDIYGVGQEGFVPKEEIIAIAEKIRQQLT